MTVALSKDSVGEKEGEMHAGEVRREEDDDGGVE
jgi:hypothetical protein